MDVKEITSLIGSLGFPIIACVYMWRYINTTMKDFTKTMEENTQVLIRLCEKLDDIEGGADNVKK